MATVTVSEAATSAISSPVDIKQFVALEQRVDALVTQLQQLVPPLTSSGRQSQKNGRPSFPYKVPSFNNQPLTPETLPGTPEVGLSESQGGLTSINSVVANERPEANVAGQILDIIQRYGDNIVSGEDSWPGKTKFMPLVETFVSKSEPVMMVLPAFPFKSPNRRDKTLGSLPDLGEEVALMHLNGLCSSIAEIYKHGANVVITSDGLVYNGESTPVDEYSLY